MSVTHRLPHELYYMLPFDCSVVRFGFEAQERIEIIEIARPQKSEFKEIITPQEQRLECLKIRIKTVFISTRKVGAKTRIRAERQRISRVAGYRSHARCSDVTRINGSPLVVELPVVSPSTSVAPQPPGEGVRALLTGSLLVSCMVISNLNRSYASRPCEARRVVPEHRYPKAPAALPYHHRISYDWTLQAVWQSRLSANQENRRFYSMDPAPLQDSACLLSDNGFHHRLIGTSRHHR